MNILLGYLVIFIYAFLLIFVIGNFIKRSINLEISRKVIHFLLFFIWVFIDIFLKNTIHQFIIPMLFIVINSLSYKFKIFKTIEREEENHPGTIFFSIAVSLIYLISFLAPSFYEFTFYAVAALTIGDGSASIFGHLIKSPKIVKNKTLSGFIACFIATFLANLLFYLFGKSSLDVQSLVMISICAGIFELVGYGLDNFSITLGIFFISFMINSCGVRAEIGLAFSIAIFLIVFFSKLITYYGALLSAAIVFVFFYFGDYLSLSFLLLLYLISIICGVIRKIKKYKEDDIVQKHGKKDAIQIFVNGFIPSIFVICSYFISREFFLIVALLSLSSNLVDSVSSDIGVLSKKEPYDIFRHKKVERGVSGGMSLLGTLSALLTSVLLSVLLPLFLHTPWFYIPFFVIIIFSGTFIDSFLGSFFQKKNQCVVCNKVTEKEIHCDCKCVKISGIKFINNDVVNLLSCLFVSIFSCIFLVI